MRIHATLLRPFFINKIVIFFILTVVWTVVVRVGVVGGISKTLQKNSVFKICMLKAITEPQYRNEQ